VRAFPWKSLPRLRRDDAALVRACARRLPLAAPGAAADALGDLLGAHPKVTTMPIGVVPAGSMTESLGDPIVAILLAHPEGPSRARVAVELDPRLAGCIVDRALGGTAGDDVPEPSGPLGDVERGVLAFVAARAVARSGQRPWRVLSVVTTASAMVAALHDEGAVVWPVAVTLGADSGVARAWVPRAALASTAEDGARPPAWIGKLAVTVVAHGARGVLSADDLDALRPGDVVVLDETWLESAKDGWAGRAAVRAVGASRTTFWCALHGGDEPKLVVTEVERTPDLPAKKGTRRMEDTDTDTGTDRAVGVAGDAAVSVSVEIARFTMPLEELAALRAGEVVVTGRAIGEQVAIRAGERTIASGELVDVDGEVGVRILTLGE
jgi:type III secretion system YscQ/HrcQ family protein